MGHASSVSRLQRQNLTLDHLGWRHHASGTNLCCHLSNMHLEQLKHRHTNAVSDQNPDR